MGFTSVTVAEDAQVAYEGAQERAMLLREEWRRLGQPVIAVGSRKQPVIHPLLGAIAEAEVIADRLRQRLLKQHRGPSPSAVLGVTASPARLRRNGQS